MRAPASVAWIAGVLEQAGFDTWAVGGAVRDHLLGSEGGDWDLATAARPEQVRKLFRRTVPVGIEHGTVGVLDRDRCLHEVTTFRRDVLPLGRKAVVEFADRIEDDLARRDFTINAVAWHPLRDELRDPFGGVTDIAARMLRCVGDPGARFQEDHLRILRGLRFAGRFRLEIEPATWAAMLRDRSRTAALSGERIREELFKIVSKDRRPSRALALYRATGVWGVLLPEVEAALREAPDTWARALATADRLSLRDPLLRLAPLLLPAAGQVGLDGFAAALRRLRFSNAETDRLVHLAVLQDMGLPAGPGGPVRRWLHTARGTWRAALALALAEARVRAARGEDVTATLSAVRDVRRERGAEPPLQIGDLAIGGGDLKRAGLRPGPDYGRILAHLLDRVLDDPGLNRPERLLEMVKTWVEEQGTRSDRETDASGAAARPEIEPDESTGPARPASDADDAGGQR